MSFRTPLRFLTVYRKPSLGFSPLILLPPSIGIEHYAKIQLTGPAPYAGFYTFPANVQGQTIPGHVVTATGPAGGLQISFANNLSSTNDLLAIVKINTVTDTAPTGGVGLTGTPIQYQINSSTVLNGIPETIGGNFTFDPFSLLEYGAIFLTGGPPYANTYSIQLEISPSANSIQLPVLFATGAPKLTISFVNNLSFAADPIASVVLPPLPFAIDNAPTGEAVPFATPEPTSLALLGAALGLFLLSPRASRAR